MSDDIENALQEADDVLRDVEADDGIDVDDWVDYRVTVSREVVYTVHAPADSDSEISRAFEDVLQKRDPREWCYRQGWDIEEESDQDDFDVELVSAAEARREEMRTRIATRAVQAREDREDRVRRLKNVLAELGVDLDAQEDAGR